MLNKHLITQKKWIVALLLISATSLKAETSPATAESLVNLLDKIQTFKARFHQQIRDPQGERISSTKGDMIIRRPGKFYWKSQTPDPVIIVADGKYLWTYDIDLEQVTQQDLAKALQNSPAALLAGGLSHLKQDFNIEMAPTQCQKDANQCFILKPTQKDAPYGDIIIGFANDSLQEVRMHDPLGQDIHTTFTQVKINSEINDKLFTFVPPAGVDVIQAKNE